MSSTPYTIHVSSVLMWLESLTVWQCDMATQFIKEDGAGEGRFWQRWRGSKSLHSLVLLWHLVDGVGGAGNHYGITAVTGTAGRNVTAPVEQSRGGGGGDFLLSRSWSEDRRDNAWSDELSGQQTSLVIFLALIYTDGPAHHCQYNETNFHTIAAFRLQDETQSWSK